MTFLSLSSGRCRCALARTRPAARRAAALRSSLGLFNGDHPARWWIGRRSAMLVTSPCRSSAIVPSCVRAYIERLLPGLHDPSGSRWWLRPSHFAANVVRKDRRCAGRKNLGRHRAAAAPVTETKPWRRCPTSSARLAQKVQRDPVDLRRRVGGRCSDFGGLPGVLWFRRKQLA